MFWFEFEIRGKNNKMAHKISEIFQNIAPESHTKIDTNTRKSKVESSAFSYDHSTSDKQRRRIRDMGILDNCILHLKHLY